MTLDWNWFFAAFAQSGAALIAIIGAFIISKLLGESEKEEENSNELEELIIHYNDLRKKISGRYFEWCDEREIEASSELEDAIENGDFDGLKGKEKLSKLFEIIPDLFKTKGCEEVLDKRIHDLKKTFESTFGPKIGPFTNLSGLSEEKELINSLKIESETLIEQFKRIQFKLKIASKNLVPIKVTIIILMGGIILTVIYPLHFMPLEINQTPNLVLSVNLFFELLFSLKGLLLLVLTIVIEGIFGYFLALISRTENKYDKTSRKILDEYLNIKSYSEYF